MQDDMDNVLNEYTDKVFKAVAECFAAGDDKSAKNNVKEMLRVVQHKARRKITQELGNTVLILGKKIYEDKGW